MIYFASILWVLLLLIAFGSWYICPQPVAAVLFGSWCVMTAVLALYRKERR